MSARRHRATSRSLRCTAGRLRSHCRGGHPGRPPRATRRGWLLIGR